MSRVNNKKEWPSQLLLIGKWDYSSASSIINYIEMRPGSHSIHKEVAEIRG